MPFVVPLLVALWVRKRLWRRLGTKVGNIIGKAAIFSLGGPPLLLGCVTLLLGRLVLNVVTKVEQVVKAWKTG